MDKTYRVEIDGWGEFVVNRLTMGRNMEVAAEYERHLRGMQNTTREFRALANTMATAKVLVAVAPEGWSLDDLDPLDPQTYERLFDLASKIDQQERFFRSAPGGHGPRHGEESGGVGGVVVSQDVPPGAD